MAKSSTKTPAKPAAAAKDVAAQSQAGGASDGDAGAATNAVPNTETPKPDPKAAAAALRKAAKDRAEVRLFTVTSSVLHDNDALRPGDPAAFTQAQFTALKSAGVVEGKWLDGVPVDD